MKKTALSTAIIACLIGLSGCSSPPEPQPILPQTLAEEFLSHSSIILASGGLAVVGMAESKSLEIALNKAKVNGRLGLADLLAVKIETLRSNLIKETGLDPKDPLLAPFDDAVQLLAADRIQNLPAAELKYETTDDDTVMAYALMELSPLVIVDCLTDDEELSELFLNSQVYKTLDQEVKTYDDASVE